MFLNFIDISMYTINLSFAYYILFLQSSVWFPTKTQVKFVGDITVKHVSEARGSHVTMTKLVLQSKVLFLHFSLTDWCLTVLYLLNSKDMFLKKI